MDKETLYAKFTAVMGDADTATGMIGDTNISKRTLESYVDAIIPGIKDDESVTGDYLDSHVSVLRAMGGQMRHQVKTEIDGFRAKSAKSGDSNAAAADTGTASAAGYDSLNRQIAELRRSMEDLSERSRKASEEKTQAEMMAALKAAMRRSNATDDYVLEKTMQGVTLDTAKTVGQLTEEHLKRYDAELKACRGDGAQPRAAQGGGGGKTYADQFFARKKAKEGWGEKKP